MTKDKLLKAIAEIQRLPAESSDLYTALRGLTAFDSDGEQELDTRIVAYADSKGIIELSDADRISILRAWLDDLDSEAATLAQINRKFLGDEAQS